MQVLLGLKRALAMLQSAVPPSPLGIALHGRLAEHVAGVPLGALLLRSLLMGLASWMPSWILGEVCVCCWELRQHSALFGTWLSHAISPDRVPRVVSLPASRATAAHPTQSRAPL